MLAPRAAALAGYLGGIAFFALGFSWFGETAGSLVGPAAPLLSLGPAALEAFAFAAVAVVASYAARRVDVRLVPLVVASAFAFAEAVRSSGTLGLPFSQLGVAMVGSPLRAIAAFAGGYGITFAAALLGASLGWWMLARDDARRARTALATWALVALATSLAWAFWPARHAPAPTRRVAAVQGGIAQTLKRSEQGLTLAIDTYTRLTQSLAAARPALVLWPETVITEDLGADPVTSARFAQLANALHTTLYAGTIISVPGSDGYNALRIYGPQPNAYRKEQLVPFAEYLPGPPWLRSLPLANEVSAFLPGTNAVETIDGATPLICWESLFADIAHARLAQNPSLFLVATDDAWFDRSEAPYEHADAASLRAIETGRWVLQAGATGVSGIVAPDGHWTVRAPMHVATTVVGDVGAPAPGPFARIGPLPVILALGALMVLPFARRRRA